MSSADTQVNLAQILEQAATRFPQRVALYFPKGKNPDGKIHYAQLSFSELELAIREVALGLTEIKIQAGMRVALMVKPSPEFFILMYALFRIAAVPVLIDPGINKRALRECLEEAEPHAFIGIPLAHWARIVLGFARSAKILVTVGRRWFWSGHTYTKLGLLGRKKLNSDADIWQPSEPNSLAAILFTSGSTGIPKGVEYTQAQFIAQLEMLRAAFDFAEGEVDLPTFPPFALFDPALGITAIIPPMDFTQPAKADPKKLLQAIEQFKVTTMFASPALLDSFSRYGRDHQIKLNSVLRVCSAGAPVRPDIVSRMFKMLPREAKIFTPYGATECLPLALIEGREILSHGKNGTDMGRGICVGYVLDRNQVRIIEISEESVATWADAKQIPANEVGEITVKGPTTTRAYFRRTSATELAKIMDGDDVVHRMGDLGYFDDEGRLWYCGRKSHRVETKRTVLFSECVEGIFNTHTMVRRSALVGVGPQGFAHAVVCIEAHEKLTSAQWALLREQLTQLAQTNTVTQSIDTFLLHPAFPVDIRHNAKIGREHLAAWAAKKILNT